MRSVMRNNTVTVMAITANMMVFGVLLPLMWLIEVLKLGNLGRNGGHGRIRNEFRLLNNHAL